MSYGRDTRDRKSNSLRCQVCRVVNYAQVYYYPPGAKTKLKFCSVEHLRKYLSEIGVL